MLPLFRFLIKRGVVVVVLLFAFLASNCQAKMYKTYDDYLNKKSEFFESVSHSNSVLTFKGSGDKVKYKTSEIWGFEFNDRLFRTFESDFYLVTSDNLKGKIILYTDGPAFLLVEKGKTVYYNNPSDVMSFWISSGINGNIFLTGFNPINSKPPKKYKKGYAGFQEAHPEHQKFYDCIGDGNYQLLDVTKCIKTYNGNP